MANVNNIITNLEILEGIEDYVSGNSQVVNAPRVFTIDFDNFQVMGGEEVKRVYRNFHHALLTHEQACDTVADALYDLIDIIDEAEHTEVLYFDLLEDSASLHCCVDGHPYDAHIWVTEVGEAYEPEPVPVCRVDEFWK